MLPLRLGTVNANGPQDLIIYALTKNGRVETANYRTVKLPSDIDVPLFVKHDFGNFYKAMFDRAVARENMRAVFVEYAWDMGWCDPCAADPLSNKELVELGARWIGSDDDKPFRGRVQGANAYVTRLHVRYDARRFPEDLVLIETRDRTQLPGPLRAPATPGQGKASCEAGAKYRASLPARFGRRRTISPNLTGWPQAEIERRMERGTERGREVGRPGVRNGIANLATPHSPAIGLTRPLSGKTLPASTVSSRRRWSLSTPLSTLRRSVVGLRSRPSCRLADLSPGQSATTRPPLRAPPASNATVAVP